MKRAELPGHPRGADEYAMRRAKAIVRATFGPEVFMREPFQRITAGIAREIAKATRYQQSS